MAEDEFQRLLELMPKIADAVKALPPELQQSGYTDLVAAFRGAVPASTQAAGGAQSMGNVSSAPGEAEEPYDGEDAPPRPTKTTRKVRARKASARKQWTPDRHLDFWPADKQPFKDFVEEKKPTTIDQKNLLAIHWFEQVAELEEISVGQVLAAYKLLDWHEPSDPENALQATASRTHWIDTKTMKKIATTPSGRNTVKSMPIEKAKK